MAIFKKQLLCCKGNPGQTIKFQLLFPLEMSSVGVDFWLMFQNESIIWGLLNDRYRLRNLGMSDMYRACNLNSPFKVNFVLHSMFLYFFFLIFQFFSHFIAVCWQWVKIHLFLVFFNWDILYISFFLVFFTAVRLAFYFCFLMSTKNCSFTVFENAKSLHKRAP